MKEIELSQGFKALVDEEDYPAVSQYKWSVMRHKGNNYYALRMEKINGRNKVVLMHRFILGKIPEGYEVDHINRNGLDNRRSNLRIVTRQENLANQRNRQKSIGIYKTGRHLYKLVYFKEGEKITEFFTRKAEAIRRSKEVRKGNF